ncbi:hypothetical protein [Roseobacter sp. EG26]|uniref:hypothetical protein n=1 Tax=Roseobacter sp. EG26 TaxID=3412477 RepID=UPI003CE53098
MQKQSWLLDQIKEIEKAAEETGQESLTLGLKHALIVCAQEADAITEDPAVRNSHSTLTSAKSGTLAN